MKKIKILTLAVSCFMLFGLIDVRAGEVNDENALRTCLTTPAVETCVLSSNVEVEGNIVISAGQTVTIDLAGYTIKPKAGAVGSTISYKGGLIKIEHGGNLTINDSSTGKTGKITVGSDKVGSEGLYAGIFVGSDTDTSKVATLNVTGGTIEGFYYAVTGNGNQHNTVINISGGSLKGLNTSDCLGIYHPQDGKLTITGGTIEGTTGIEMRAGTLVVNGEDVAVRGTGKPVSSTPNADGSTTVGAGIAVVQHTTDKKISVTISKGNIEGYNAFYQADTQDRKHPEMVTLNISGGDFVITDTAGTSVFSSNKTGFVTSGTFGNNVDSKYLASTVKAVADGNGGYKVVRKSNSSSSSTTTEPKSVEVSSSFSKTDSDTLKDTLKDTNISIGNRNVLIELASKVLSDSQVDSKVKEAINKAIVSRNANLKVGSYYDIAVNVIDKDSKAKLGNLTDLKKTITLRMTIPVSLRNTSANVVRTYYVVRSHNGVVDILDTKLYSDKTYVTFATDKFSTYALAYVDTIKSNDKTGDDVQTGDKINSTLTMGGISLIGLIVASLYVKKNKLFS